MYACTFNIILNKHISIGNAKEINQIFICVLNNLYFQSIIHLVTFLIA